VTQGGVDDRGRTSHGRAAGAATGPLADARVEDAVTLLRAHGGRITAARRVMLECLFDGPSHRTAEDLAAQVQARDPEVHLSTIYRNLEELERLGVVVHAHLGHGPAVYHLAADPHGHLVCESCGTTVEAPGELFEGLIAQAASGYGFTVDPRHFAVMGRCGACTAAAAPPAGTPA
jgi:Fe2+ or Zn2+ uptake regulation protein